MHGRRDAFRMPVGIVGCGNIFERYVAGLRRFDDVEIVWCADIDRSLAERRAEELEIPNAGAPTEAASDELRAASLVVNLTPPSAHAQVTAEFLEARKHVYTEKPLATTLADARGLLEAAAQRSLQLGAAPDWLLSRSARGARAALEAGSIGEPIAASAFITHSAVERWHPDPRGFFLPGAGPVFDLGPYYVSALVHLLGPVRTVAALETTGRPRRPVTAPYRVVDTVEVQVPTHAAAILEFESGVTSNLTMSFEAWERTMPFIEIYGSEGTLSLPMPHERDDAVKVKRHGDEEWTELELPDGEPYIRGIGVVDMARALSSGAAIQASGALGYHVLEVLTAVDTSSAERRFVPILGVERALNASTSDSTRAQQPA
jgi:predicted dehydrogenase